MILLGIDTATGPFGAALWKEGALAGYRECLQPGRQSAELMPMIETLLAETQTSYHQLTAIACSVGPGSFTSIRVGLAAARGLCLSLGIPGWGLTTLEVMAFGQQHAQSNAALTCLIAAGKGEFYAQSFAPEGRQPGALNEAMVAPLERIFETMPAGCHLISNAALPAPHTLASPRADHLATLAAIKKGGLALSPFYIRPPDAKPMDTTNRRDMMTPNS